MIKLNGKLRLLSGGQVDSHLTRLTKNRDLPTVLANQYGLILDENIQSPLGYKFILRKKLPNNLDSSQRIEYLIPEDLQHLDEGDIIRVDVQSRVRVLYRKQSNQNSILITEQCNHYCLMCSQPPKDVDDGYIIDEVFDLIKLIPQDTLEIGFTGGEPTLFGNKFLDLINLTKSYLPNTSLHILSNGRTFQDIKFTRDYAKINHPDVMIGIPIYSDDPVMHDYIVQATNAYNETIRGILNLKSLNQKVEIRVVIHKLNAFQLSSIADFIVRNLQFVDHVALMGLEIIGFTRANLDLLWIDQIEYKDELSKATKILNNYGMNVSIYNHQLCLVNEDIQFAYRKSISDWKNDHVPECEECIKKQECGGFFTSSVLHKYSSKLKPFKKHNLIERI